MCGGNNTVIDCNVAECRQNKSLYCSRWFILWNTYTSFWCFCWNHAFCYEQPLQTISKHSYFLLNLKKIYERVILVGASDKNSAKWRICIVRDRTNFHYFDARALSLIMQRTIRKLKILEMMCFIDCVAVKMRFLRMWTRCATKDKS